MSDYSDFELKIIAQAKKEVEESANYSFWADLGSFIKKQFALAGKSRYRFRKWNKEYKREQILQQFSDWGREIRAECELLQDDLGQKSPVISENDIVDITVLTDKEQAIFYKAKADFLAREFSESNIFFLSIFLPLIEQMLKMNKRPADLFDGEMIKKLKQNHKARVRGGGKLHLRISRDRDAELKIFEIMHDIATIKLGSLSRWDKHLLLIKFCVVSNVIDIEISKEEKRQKKIQTEKAKLIRDHLKELKEYLAKWETCETILAEYKEKKALNNLGVYCKALNRHGKNKLANALRALDKKLSSCESIEAMCCNLDNFDKMLLEYGANIETLEKENEDKDNEVNIFDWLNGNPTLRPFVQDMLRRVRQRLQTSRITSTGK